ncbi:hypothetical protein VOLCADRAFT_96145 [Volvox carteri f. nagariensis]|uniref:Uncharacterized protein n=1 Tax=Volvox carteri f. nagariensis TaxID=3068 RepID=D8U9B8_VOLCA|nr:uncharacterized protein VOLCADRAFT_96145 [Volvox carteri f. nagariensis]EFJ43727.1 hypothetical protein VOLCADRAFT_96145 [Volvox carteri f. nagariensis]|eukprot:XP_002955208.1 hypothetical protein VOLCADRAFT_96145 [Volvox carteri f. nagariensis]
MRAVERRSVNSMAQRRERSTTASAPLPQCSTRRNGLPTGGGIQTPPNGKMNPHSKNAGNALHAAHLLPALPGSITGHILDDSALPAQLLLACNTTTTGTACTGTSATATAIANANADAGFASLAGFSSPRHDEPIATRGPPTARRTGQVEAGDREADVADATITTARGVVTEPWRWHRCRTGPGRETAAANTGADVMPDILPSSNSQPRPGPLIQPQPSRLFLPYMWDPSPETYSDLQRSNTAPPAPPRRILRDWGLFSRLHRTRLEARYAVTAAAMSDGQVLLGDSIPAAGDEDYGRISSSFASVSVSSIHGGRSTVGAKVTPLGLLRRLLHAFTKRKRQGLVTRDGKGRERDASRRTQKCGDTLTTVSYCSLGATRYHSDDDSKEEEEEEDAEKALQVLQRQRCDSKILARARLGLGVRRQDPLAAASPAGPPSAAAASAASSGHVYAFSQPAPPAPTGRNGSAGPEDKEGDKDPSRSQKARISSIANLRARLAGARRSVGAPVDAPPSPKLGRLSLYSLVAMQTQSRDEQCRFSEPVAVLASTRTTKRLGVVAATGSCGD